MIGRRNTGRGAISREHSKVAIYGMTIIITTKIIDKFVRPIAHALETASTAKEIRVAIEFTDTCSAKL